MYDSDYIKVYRNEINDPLFEDKELFRLWLWLRLSAAKKSRVQLVGNTRIRVKVNFGQYATTVKALAKKCERDCRTIDEYLNDLAADGRITFNRDGQVTLITILNYELYAQPETDEVGMDGSLSTTDIQKLYDQLKSELMTAMSSMMQKVMSDELRSLMQEEMQNLMQNLMQSGMQSQTTPSMQQPMQKSPHSPIVVEEDKKIIINSSTAPSREREIEFYEKLKNADDATMASMMRTLEVGSREDVLAWMEKYMDYNISASRFHTDQKDFNSNFLTWYRSYTKKKENSNRHTNGRNEEKQGGRRGSVADRRGSEGTAQSPDDYDAPFPTEDGAS